MKIGKKTEVSKQLKVISLIYDNFLHITLVAIDSIVLVFISRQNIPFFFELFVFFKVMKIFPVWI